MSLALDAYDILRRIGSNPELFAGLRSSVAEVAEDLVKRELTSKSLDLETFRALVGALGEENVALIIETLEPDDVLALVRTLDPRYAKARSKDVASAERHLMDLAMGRAGSDAASMPARRAKPAPPRTKSAAKKKSARKPASKASPATSRRRASPFGTAAMGAKAGE
jgi:hypothetical protein